MNMNMNTQRKMPHENDSERIRIRKLAAPQSHVDHRRPMKEYGASPKTGMEPQRGIRKENYLSPVDPIEDEDTHHTSNVKRTLSVPVSNKSQAYNVIPRSSSGGQLRNLRRTKSSRSLSPYNDKEGNKDISKTNAVFKNENQHAGDDIVCLLERSLEDYAASYSPAQVRELLKRLQQTLDGAASKNSKHNNTKLIPIKKSFKKSPIRSSSDQQSGNSLESDADESMPHHFKPIPPSIPARTSSKGPVRVAEKRMDDSISPKPVKPIPSRMPRERLENPDMDHLENGVDEIVSPAFAGRTNSKGPVHAAERRMDNSISPKPVKPITSRMPRGRLENNQDTDHLEKNVDEIVSKNFKSAPPRRTRTPSPKGRRRMMGSNPLRKTRSKSPMISGRNADANKKRLDPKTRSPLAASRNESLQNHRSAEVEGEGTDSLERSDTELFDDDQRAYIDNLFGMNK